MHFQNSYNDSSYMSAGGGSVMVDNTASWPLIVPSSSDSYLGVPATTGSVYNTESLPRISQNFFQYTVPTTTTEVVGGFPSSLPYYPEVEEQSPPSSMCSPLPSSPSLCDSMTDSPAASSPSLQNVDIRLQHMVEQSSAAVVNLPNPVKAKSEASVQEQLKSIKPLLRKPIDTTRMNDKQMDRLMRRRSRNKQAAERCRVKRREKSSQIRTEMALLTRSNDELEQELVRLRNEMQGLQQMICNHHCHIGHSKEDLIAMVSDLDTSS